MVHAPFFHPLLGFPDSLWHMSTRLHTRQQIQNETQNIEGEDISDGPFNTSRGVLMGSKHRTRERNRQQYFNTNEDKLDPETYAQNAVIAVVDSQTLVFGTDEDRREDIACNEEEEHAVVETVMMVCIFDRKSDESCGACESADAGCGGEGFLEGRCVRSKFAVMSQPAFGEEGSIEGDDHDGRAGDEQRF